MRTRPRRTGGPPVARRRIAARQGGQDQVLPVAGGDQQHLAPQVLEQGVGRHGPDDRAAHPPLQRGLPGQQLAAQLVGHLPHGGGGQQRLVGHHAQHLDPLALQAQAHVLAHLGELVRQHLVDDDPQQRHALLVEERLVEHHLVDGLADAGAADQDHRRAQQAGHLGVGQVDHRAHPRVPGPLHEHEIPALRAALERLLHPGGQLAGGAFADVALGEPRGDGHRAHVRQGAAGVEQRVDQDGVLVHLVPADRVHLLPDGFDVAHPRVARAHPLHQPQDRGGLAFVLPGGGDVDARGPVHGANVGAGG